MASFSHTTYNKTLSVVAKKTSFTKEEVREVLDAFAEVIVESMENEGVVHFPPIGRFSGYLKKPTKSAILESGYVVLNPKYLAPRMSFCKKLRYHLRDKGFSP